MDKMYIKLSLLLIVSIWKINAQDFILFPNIGMYYKFHRSGVSWNEARKTCMSENATMVLPRNEEDVQVLQSIFAAHSEFLYIGMHRFFNNREYVTLKGRSIQYYYNNWDMPNQPWGSEDQNCIALNKNGNLHDMSCDDKYPFICEKSAVEIDIDYQRTHYNPDCVSSDSEYRYFPGIEKCYKIHMIPQSWGDARIICESEGSNLAIIRGKTEEKLLSAMFREAKYKKRYATYPNLAFIGVHELFEKGEYLTDSGENFTDIQYSNWSPGKPTIKRNHCLALDKDGGLNDINCNIDAYFICEQPSKTLSNRINENDYTFLGKFAAFYKVHYEKQNYSDAITTCAAEGGELLTPTSRKELLMILKTVASSINQFYVGINDLLSEGKFLTLKGASIDEVYSTWALGEPDNQNDNEDCVVVKKNSLYYDKNCGKKQHFLCKKDLNTVTENAICETYDTGYFYEDELDRCYKIHTSPKNWSDAFRICKFEEADLVIINSEIEARMLVREFEKHPEKFLRGNFEKGLMHLGFHDMYNEGVHLTLDGKLLSQSGYEKWSLDQPNDKDDKEDCGSMFRDGTLNDIHCDTRAFFACEKKIKRDPPVNSNAANLKV